MQIGRDPLRLQRHRLIRAPAGNEGKARGMCGDGSGLFSAQRIIDKAQNAHTPGPVAQLCLGLGQQRIDLWLTHQRQRHKRQRPAIGHGQRERRAHH